MFKDLKFTLLSAAISASAKVSPANASGYAVVAQFAFVLLLATAQAISRRLRRPRPAGWKADSRQLRKDAPRKVLQHCT
jgi:hypothetical protein